MHSKTPHRVAVFALPPILAIALSVVACGSIVDVANTAASDGGVATADGGLDGAVTSDGGVSAASWEARPLPWTAPSYDFHVFDQTVVAVSLTSGAPSYVLDLSPVSNRLPEVSLGEQGAPVVGTFRASSPNGRYVAFAGATWTTFYEVSGALVARGSVGNDVLPVLGSLRVDNDGSWGQQVSGGVLFGRIGDAAVQKVPVENGQKFLRSFPKERMLLEYEKSGGAISYVLVNRDGQRTALGEVYGSFAGPMDHIRTIPDRLLVNRGNTHTEVWSLSDPPQMLGGIPLDGRQVQEGSDAFLANDRASDVQPQSYNLVASAAPPGVRKILFSLQGSEVVDESVIGYVRKNDKRTRIRISKDRHVVTALDGQMLLGSFPIGRAVTFSEGRPVAAGPVGFVAWTVDGAKSLPPVSFAIYPGLNLPLSLRPAGPALQFRGGATAITSIGRGGVFWTVGDGFARGELPTTLFDRNAATPRGLPVEGLPCRSYDCEADRGFSVNHVSTKGACLYQFGANETWSETGRCLGEPSTKALVSDNAGDAFAVATETEVLVSLPGQPTLRAPSAPLVKVAFDGKRLLGFDAASTVYVFEIKGSSLEKVFERLIPGVQSVALDATRDRGLLGLDDGAALLVAK